MNEIKARAALALLQEALAPVSTDAAAGTATAVAPDLGPVLLNGSLPPVFVQEWGDYTINRFQRERAQGKESVSLAVYAASWANQASPGEREAVRRSLGRIVASPGIPVEFYDKPYSFLLSRFMYLGDYKFMTADEIAVEESKKINPTRGE